MQHRLNDLFLSYFYGRIDRNDFKSAVFYFLVKNQEKSCLSHWESDEYEEFISWFYPRLDKCIESYRDTGASFEAFLNKFILVASKEYHTRNMIRSVIEYSAWSARVPEMYAHEEPPQYKYGEKDSYDTKNIITGLIIDKKNGKINTKRILALILKCYYHISDDFAEKIASLIGMNSKDLTDLLNQIKELRQKKDNDIYLLKERTFSQFYRCMVLEKRISIVNENTVTHKKLIIRLEKARKRLEKMRNRMASIRTEATNKQIADVIGVKKGTVDSSLHQLRSRWKEAAKKADLN